ncbi:ABC transporter permease [Acetobacterium carbinolicum]|jgi:ABC-type multidrug transport system permease subunit|uniref:ABC transporter permease n=1 Tax=Acetobacterium TaxID=33951 RepID=UPI000DBEB55A|nr:MULTISPECIES: ABC transporter permease [unclassified Acetobacterium]AWW28045.1 multidrug ABC transporter permease [Acetobacterium sp. KB-1]MDK2940603.1 type transport system permease protein [Acetobacterium sp.]MDZ5726471.1 ABC transporter permease [Acetobacterium sp. K1/6]
MSGLYGILWQEFAVFKRKFVATSISFLISPILYLVAFGWGLGSGVEIGGVSYMAYIIPGIIGMSTMMTSFNNTANTINISRIFYKTFEDYMISPINMTVYALGKIIAGAFYGIYSATLIIIMVSIFTNDLVITPYFILIALLNCFVFSALGFLIGLLVNSHSDMAKFTSFVITPMSFLCGTFFSIDKMPEVLKWIIYLLPLTHTNIALRTTGESSQQMALHAGILVAYLVVLFVLGARHCKTVE